ncbi:helix-turn-helix transcriptional regulator [Bacteroides stercoris]|uniref:helix-turn-helix transcriptional regulator n=1 Tax=Bacteroides stercoris TaxID=46506 RepID=UPI00293D5876|nr:helix-turn-helix transcriptional regulator [Bacteroides stercoris]
MAETRKEKGLSQMQLSELTGITSKNIANIEAGKYNTEIDTLAKIAKALNCKIDFIQK